MCRNRILELAVEELERQKAGVEVEIEAVRAELRGSETPGKSKSAATTISKRRPRTPAQRRAHSQRLRKYWAAKKTGEAKVKTPTPKPEKTAVSKAISAAMRASWAKRKAKPAGKTANKVPKKAPKA